MIPFFFIVCFQFFCAFCITIVEPGLYLRRIMETSELHEEDNILLCQYLRWFEDGRIELDEVTYLNGDNCASSNAETVWTQYIEASRQSYSRVSKCDDYHVWL